MHGEDCNSHTLVSLGCELFMKGAGGKEASKETQAGGRGEEAETEEETDTEPFQNVKVKVAMKVKVKVAVEKRLTQKRKRTRNLFRKSLIIRLTIVRMPLISIAK